MKKKAKNKTKKPKREFVQFTLEDRTKIEIRYGDGWSLRKIAEYLGNNRTAGSVCREIGGKPRKGSGRYQAHIAQREALKRRKGKRTVRLKNEDTRSYVKEKLKLGWSPEQISIRLPMDHKGLSISHEAIYQYIYADDTGKDARKALGKPKRWKEKENFPRSKTGRFLSKTETSSGISKTTASFQDRVPKD